MNITALKTLLKILSQQLCFEEQNTLNSKKSVDINSLYSLIKQKDYSIDVVLLEELVRTKTIEDNKRANDIVKHIIFKSLKVIFLNTDQDERFNHFKDLTETIYQSIIQKLLKLKLTDTVIGEEEYRTLIRCYIPLVKLEILLETFDLKYVTIIEELVEYLKEPAVLREEVYEIIKNRLPNKTFKFTGYHLEWVVDKKGFMSEYAKLEVSVDTDCIYKFFIKFVPKETNTLQNILAKHSYRKELLFYKEFIPAVKQLAAVPVDFLPECYMVGTDFLVLKDLVVEEYSSHDEKFLKFNHLSLATRQLAKMHSSSIIFEEKLSIALGEKVEIDQYFPNVVIEDQYLPHALTETHIQHAACSLKRYPHFVGTSLQELQSKAIKKLNGIYEAVKKSARYRNVLTHADLWNTNIFYKNDIKGRPEHCILLDYQLIRYCPPALDILMLLHINTTKEYRKKHTRSLLQVYYSELESNLANFDIDVDKILSFDDLEQSVEDLKLFGIFVSTFMNNFISLLSEKFRNMLKDPKIDYWTNHLDREEVMQALWDDIDPEWKKKIEGNAEDLVELCENI